MLNSILVFFRMILLVLGGYEQVALENLALRQQIGIFQRSVRRPRIRPTDRLFWVCLRGVWKEWKSALVIVRPETVLDWQRKRFKRYWSQLSQNKNPGRPRTNADIRKTGEDDGRSQCGLGRTTTAPSQTWRTFLDNHVHDLASIDFFTVPTARLPVLFVFIVLSHERRRIVHF